MKKPETKNKNTAVICWFLTIGYMGIIFYLSSLTGTDLPYFPQYFDKAIHIFIYIPLAFLCSFSFRKSGIKKNVFILSFIITVFYGFTDEIHQIYVQGREFAAGDILADSLGALLGSWLERIKIKNFYNSIYFLTKTVYKM